MNCNILLSCRKYFLAFNSVPWSIKLYFKFTDSKTVLEVSEILNYCYIKTILYKYFTELNILLSLIIGNIYPWTASIRGLLVKNIRAQENTLKARMNNTVTWATWPSGSGPWQGDRTRPSLKSLPAQDILGLCDQMRGNPGPVMSKIKMHHNSQTYWQKH